MPQIKTLTVNNGTTDTTYVPVGSTANNTTFLSRGSSLKGISRITSTHNPVSPSALVQRQSLVLDRNKELTVDGRIVTQKVTLFDLGVAQSVEASREDRLAALNEFKSLLDDTDVVNSIVDNEAFY